MTHDYNHLIRRLMVQNTPQQHKKHSAIFHRIKATMKVIAILLMNNKNYYRNGSSKEKALTRKEVFLVLYIKPNINFRRTIEA